MNASSSPLVSILIRSMDRPTLQRALDSAAEQTWPNLEIVVVAACGKSHRQLPDTYGGRPLRFVVPENGLHRAEAANACLDAANGEWLNFLDDDDGLLPTHIETLLNAERGNARVLYSRARIHDTEGRLTGHCGFASFPVQLYYQNRSHPAATLFHRSLVEEGARFDPQFVVYEDHDFFVNLASRTEFRFVNVATCVWNAYDGESGCGHGANTNEPQREKYYDKMHRKWAALFDRWLREPEALIFLGQHNLRSGDPNVALDCLERALVLRPSDINALNLCGLANYHAGNLDRAQVLLTDAAARFPDHMGVAKNLDLVRRKHSETVQEGVPRKSKSSRETAN
jgi:glycosyltransferase involved in cell wall biosynthesis